ncbi:hypothetical protein E2C01_006815 [Portunus trituberculatus]|uniref:Uncharacterized protein n=1 Tax=Portunus trituberculatus TaxID=210409 RepID=A0A5B7CWD1_PORTR|nr:hypothetical protein [Portunus trituberculatus]
MIMFFIDLRAVHITPLRTVTGKGREREHLVICGDVWVGQGVGGRKGVAGVGGGSALREELQLG